MTLGIAVSTVSTMCAPYHLQLGLLPTAAHPDVAPVIVSMWSMIMKKPHTDDSNLRDSVRKMQLRVRDQAIVRCGGVSARRRSQGRRSGRRWSSAPEHR
ncbi:hypothetical protein ACFX13_038888 [Malus domestica]